MHVDPDKTRQTDRQTPSRQERKQSLTDSSDSRYFFTKITENNFFQSEENELLAKDSTVHKQEI